jgi:flavorubredoxin
MFSSPFLSLGDFTNKILIFYYSRTGNTEKMAKAVAEGISSTGKAEVEMKYFIDAEDLAGYDAILVGTPTFNKDMPIDTKRLLEQAIAKDIGLKDKVGGTFGSYGWSGEAPKLVLDLMKDKLGMLTVEPPLLSKLTPDAATLDKCREFGKRISETLIPKP